MISDSFPARAGIQLFACLQASVAPLAFIYYLNYYVYHESLFTRYFPDLFPSPTATNTTAFLHYWLGFELVFYIYFQITYSRLQKIRNPVPLTNMERMEAFYNSLKTVDDVKAWLVGWFFVDGDNNKKPKFEDLRRKNVAEWFAWAFWNSSLETVHDNPLNRRGLYQMLSTVETHYGIRFPSGYNDAIRCFRLNLDSLNAAHRPFAFYALILAGTQLANVIFRWWGLERYGSETKGYYWSNTFEMDLKEGWGGVLTHSVAKGEPERIVYWHYNPQPLTDRSVPKRTPVVFVHGIGAGIMCYIEFLFRLLGLQREVFCIELPYVSMRLVEDVPTMQETVREIEQMLESHGHKQAVFVGHSLGSALLSWVIKNASKKVAGVVMIDPICFLLHYHDVAYNFVYRIPQRANEHIITFLASRELYISHYISRHFHWHQTAFFVPSTNPNPAISTTSVTPLPQRTTVFLSEHDNLVNSPRVDAYLRSHDVESHIMPNLDHASFLFSSAWKSRILNKIAEHCDAADAEIASLTVRVGGKSVRTSSGGKRRRKRSF